MKLRELLTIAALGLLICGAYAFMQQSDEAAASRDREILAAQGEK